MLIVDHHLLEDLTQVRWCITLTSDRG